jgi:5-methylcytosine-specific restriction protein B
VVLLEPGESARTIELPYAPAGYDAPFGLPDRLLLLGTRNTADRTIARMDLAIRRRFAFVDVWPDLRVVDEQGFAWARDIFHDVLMTFAEYADDEVLRLVPGHSYLLDPRPDLDASGRDQRVVRRVQLELMPLLRDYLDERLTGSASEAMLGLADRIESRVLSWRP